MKNIFQLFCLFLLLISVFLLSILKIKTKKRSYDNNIKNHNNNFSFYNYYTYNPFKLIGVKHPLVYAFAVGYRWQGMNIFVSSLRKNGYKGDLVIAISIYDYKYLENKFEQYAIHPILIDNVWPFYSSLNKKFPINETYLKSCSIEYRNYGGYKWNIYRYSVLLCWLYVYGNKYTHIISLDIRDVVFQGNPFQWNFEDGLYVVDEKKGDDILIKNNTCNFDWIKMYKNYTKIENNKILNSGVFIGSKDYFLSFISQFCTFIRENYVIVAEQGSFIYAYYTGYFKNIKFFMNRNQNGVVLTTGIDLPEVKKLKKRNSTIFNEDGTIPYIVHQYDRCESFVIMYKNKYYV